MNKKQNISDSVIHRLPRYYRFLAELSAQGVNKISSNELAERMGTTASQVRQDFNCFGCFGQQGYGYTIAMLLEELAKIMGIENSRKAILIGAGNLGKAIAGHITFSKLGFELIGIFDNSKTKIGKDIFGFRVASIKKLKAFCQQNNVEMAILCIPKEQAANVVETLYSAGVRGYWNFSHHDLKSLHDDIIVENVHLNDSLMKLSFRFVDL